MRTVTRTVYTAEELREQCPKGFEHALEQWRKATYEDPAWAGEHRDSLKAALLAIGEDPPSIEGPRRVMAWCENRILGPLRVPWSPYKARKWNAPGAVRCCPWTGYCVDEDLLDCIKEHARDGGPPRGIKRAVERKADELWNAEVESQCTAEYFLDAADANGYEFYANGEMA